MVLIMNHQVQVTLLVIGKGLKGLHKNIITSSNLFETYVVRLARYAAKVFVRKIDIYTIMNAFH